MIKQNNIICQKVIITSKFIHDYGEERVNKSIENCKNYALELAVKYNYNNPKVIQETFIPEWPKYSAELGGYPIPNTWKECMGTFEYRIVIEGE